MERLFTSQEVADQLKIKKATVYELIKRGELKSSKIGKQIRISEKQLSEYIGLASGEAFTATGSQNQPGQSPQSGKSRYSYQARQLKNDISYPESSMVKKDYLSGTKGLVISGQDASLDLICSMIEDYPLGIPTLRSITNCYNGLYSLYFEKTHIAAIDLWNQEAENYNLSFAKNMLPGIPLTLVHVLRQPAGFYVKLGNPKEIRDFTDLLRPGIQFANREKGSGARIFLDRRLKLMTLTATDISGYSQEFLSSFSCARAVADGKADVALGNESTLSQFPMLDFIPLDETHLDLVFPTANIGLLPFAAFLEVMTSQLLKSTLSYLKGCDTSHTGEIIHL